MSDGTGFVLRRCHRDTLRPVIEHPELKDAAVVVGGRGYLLLGIHYRLSQVPNPKRHGYMMPGPPEEWACLERISDGQLADVKFRDFFDCWMEEPLNAMEVLARVKEKRGPVEQSEAGEG